MVTLLLYIVVLRILHHLELTYTALTNCTVVQLLDIITIWTIELTVICLSDITLNLIEIGDTSLLVLNYEYT